MIDRFLRRHYLHVLTPHSELYFPYGRREFLRGVMRWHREALLHERFQIADFSEKFTVILQSYKRPWNIEPMVKMLLRFTNIECVIVSNNNPKFVFRFPFSDGRIHLLNQTEHYPASMFAVLALEAAKNHSTMLTASGSMHFLCIDDDLLLFPNQIASLMRALVEDASIPHGVAGQILAPDGHVLAHHVTGESAVDVLNRAYAFTADHIQRYAEMLEQLGYKTDEEKAQLPFGSDIVLSVSGSHKPQIHDVGLLLSCPTAAKSGIARFKDSHFTEFRQELWGRIRSL